MTRRAGLYELRRATDRVLELQQRLFGSLLFGPVYVVCTVWWVRSAERLGWDNPGLTIYTFLVSVLAIYMSWVVTNILNRTSARDRARDDLEADEVERLLAMNEQQLEILRLLYRGSERSSGDPLRILVSKSEEGER